MKTCDPVEIARYEAVRQRLRTLAAKHPALLDIGIARADRKCRYCKAQLVTEGPADYFECRLCRRTWTYLQTQRRSR